MSEEEKKAIEISKVLIGLEEYNKLSYKENQAIETVLKLVDKQQEKLEEREIRLQEEINENCKLKTELYGNSISKDKIRDLLKQVNASLYHFKDSDKNNIMQRIKDRLEQLLEE